VTELSEEQLDELREDFDFNDSNGDGRIEYEEFKELMEFLEAEMSNNDIRTGFAEIDTRSRRRDRVRRVRSVVDVRSSDHHRGVDRAVDCARGLPHG
jgi:Ca2+-binding EF-hand superfamily protein